MNAYMTTCLLVGSRLDFSVFMLFRVPWLGDDTIHKRQRLSILISNKTIPHTHIHTHRPTQLPLRLWDIVSLRLSFWVIPGCIMLEIKTNHHYYICWQDQVVEMMQSLNSFQHYFVPPNLTLSFRVKSQFWIFSFGMIYTIDTFEKLAFPPFIENWLFSHHISWLQCPLPLLLLVSPYLPSHQDLLPFLSLISTDL